MRNISEDFKKYLSEDSTTLAYFMDIVCKNGEVIRINSTDLDVVTNEEMRNDIEDEKPYTYKAGGYIPSDYTYSNDGSVQKVEITGLVEEGMFEYEKILNNYYEGAEIYIMIANYLDLSLGHVKLSRGTIGDFEVENTGKFYCEFRGFSQKMNNNTVEKYSLDCRATLFDSKCKVNEQNYTELSTVSSVVDRLTFRATSLNNDPEFYVGGRVIFTSGNAKQLYSQVRTATKISDTVVEFELLKPISSTFSDGDSFNIRAGCDKKVTTCRDKFDNVENFRGEPHIPGDNVFNIMGNGSDKQSGSNPLLS